jgi:DNA modification methylase
MDEAHPDKSVREVLSLQLKLPMTQQRHAQRLGVSCRESLQALLTSDLDFHGESSAYASHNLHAFPAKFPPQLPRKFIVGLTEPGDVVLDPMAGSGTTVVEALLAGRRGLGFDIDPLALRLCKAKTTPLSVEETISAGHQVTQSAQKRLEDPAMLRHELHQRFGATELDFIDYWFAPATQLELMALIGPIENVAHQGVRAFLEMTFSSIIITKSGGVSLARDLAHTRPHRVETKAPRSALEEYRKRLVKNLRSLATLPAGPETTQVCRGDAQALALRDESVDLIVTSPPYASNAIDYMRAHKFSLVWLGHGLASLAQLRREYIGHDAALGFRPATLPDYAAQTVATLARIDPRKSVVLQRYYSEMSRTLREMARVLKPGKAAIVVVGTSTMRGMDTRTDVCLGEIGKQAGLELVHIASRRLDRDKRMMPARKEQGELASQIEARMHEEYVIGFIKPETIMPLTETRRMFAAEGRPFVVCLPSLDKVVLL